MIRQWDGLGVRRFGNPNFVDPVAREVGIDLCEVRQEFFHQFLVAFAEIGMIRFEVVANVEDVIPSEVLRL